MKSTQTTTNIRISRKIRTEQGAIIRTEIAGEWFSSPERSKLVRVRKELADIQAEEPQAGWEIETRGTDLGWHKWEKASQHGMLENVSICAACFGDGDATHTCNAADRVTSKED